MLKNYLKTAWRNIIRQRWFSLINIIGLAIGMAASIMLLVYISYERSFDQFHPQKDKIFRVLTHYHGQSEDIIPRTIPDVGRILEEGSPLVSSHCKVKDERYNLKKDDETFKGTKALMADENFVDFFHFPALRGDLRVSLADPTSIAISSDLAFRLFGEQDPIGEIVSINKFYYNMEQRRWSSRYEPMKIGAVLAPIPGNSHLDFDALISYEAYDPSYKATFANDVFTYLMIPGDSPDLTSCQEIVGDFFTQFAPGRNVTLSMQALGDIHFGGAYRYDMGQRGNLQLIIIFSLVAVFIIVIAVINFINLITARSEKRAVETCIRKVSGAGRGNIAGQFLGESLLMSMIAFFLAMVLVELFLTPFSNLLNRQLSINTGESFRLFFSLLGYVLLIGLLAGTYPAMMFSRFQPAEIMRGKYSGGRRNPLLRIVLVVVQFAISVILIISITVFNRQVQHMKHADLGFDPENVIVVEGLSQSIVNGYESLRAELLQNPRILEIGSGQAVVGFPGNGQIIRPVDGTEDQNVSITEYRVRKGFREAYGLELLAGQWFDFENLSGQLDFVLNQAAVKALGLNDPIGQEVMFHNRKVRIIGMVKDFHFSSLENSINPLLFSAYNPQFFNIVIKTSPEDHRGTVDYIRQVFTRFDSNFNFNPLYVSDHFRGLYKQQEQQNTIFNFASLLAILIAMLGLLGLSSYIVMSRTREIGIRKIMGATRWQISAVLFRDIGRWVLLANLAAWPLAWYAMESWLSNYPYRISMSVVYLIIAGIASMLIAGLTIAGHTFRASKANPVDAIRS